MESGARDPKPSGRREVLTTVCRTDCDEGFGRGGHRTEDPVLVAGGQERDDGIEQASGLRYRR